MIAAWCGAVALATISLEAPPKVGQQTVVAVIDDDGDPRAGETVRVIHRPGLVAERELAIGITDGRGRVRWTPQLPGIATIRAGDEPLAIRISQSTPPASVPVILGLLFGAGGLALAIGLGAGSRWGRRDLR